MANMLQQFGANIFFVDGPMVSFFSYPYPTRMVVVKLSDGGLWVWSPVALTEELEKEVEALGPVLHIVPPNKLHHLYIKEWVQRWPEAKLYAPPGLAKRKLDSISGLKFDEELSDDAPAAWAQDIEQALFSGSFVMQEVVFFHRPSKTAMFCDLIQRFPNESCTGFKGWVMKMDGMVGEQGSTPREWRTTFLWRKETRAARDKAVGWNAERLMLAHGMVVRENAAPVIKNALGWI